MDHHPATMAKHFYNCANLHDHDDEDMYRINSMDLVKGNASDDYTNTTNTTPRSSIGTSDSMSSFVSVRSVQVHDPYSFEAYSVIEEISPNRDGTVPKNLILPVNEHRVAILSCKSLLAPARETPADIPGTPSRVTPPCGHRYRSRRLRHKNGITYFLCSQCLLRWKECPSNRVQQQQ